MKISISKKYLSCVIKIVMVIDLLPLFGKKFNMFFPMVLSFTCLFAIFNVYSKILHLFGITNFEYKGYNKALKEGEMVLEQIAREQELMNRQREQNKGNDNGTSVSAMEIRN